MLAVMLGIASLLNTTSGRAGAMSSLLFLLSLDIIIEFCNVVWGFGFCVGPHLLLWCWPPFGANLIKFANPREFARILGRDIPLFRARRPAV